MRSFGFPGQVEALREEMRRRERRLTRRAMLGGALAGLGAGVLLGPWLGGVGGADPQRAWARELAVGPRTDLLAHHLAFCTLAERMPPDDRIWIGVGRLAHAALDLGRGVEQAEGIARRVLLVLDAWPAPGHLQRLRPRLQEVAEGR